MQRVFDFSPADHEVIVSRILVQVHRAVDDAFPLAKPASTRFAKTAFVGFDEHESTLTQQMPSEALRDANNEEFARGSANSESPLRTVRPFILSDEQPISQENTNIRQSPKWRLANNMPLKQTIIGILAIILVGLLAYLLHKE